MIASPDHHVCVILDLKIYDFFSRIANTIKGDIKEPVSSEKILLVFVMTLGIMPLVSYLQCQFLLKIDQSFFRLNIFDKEL